MDKQESEDEESEYRRRYNDQRALKFPREGFMTKPTREQIKAALEWSDKPRGRDGYTFEYDKQMDALAAAYRATQRPAQIIGRVIGYIIAAALGVLALAGLLSAVKVLVGVMG